QLMRAEPLLFEKIVRIVFKILQKDRELSEFYCDLLYNKLLKRKGTIILNINSFQEILFKVSSGQISLVEGLNAAIIKMECHLGKHSFLVSSKMAKRLLEWQKFGDQELQSSLTEEELQLFINYNCENKKISLLECYSLLRAATAFGRENLSLLLEKK